MSVGVRVFEDEEIPTSPDALPSEYVHGSPCSRGHADSHGRAVRYAKSGACVVCGRENRAKSKGIEIEPMDVDTLVALALAKERRARDEAKRKRERGNGLHAIRPKRKSSRGVSGTPGTAMRDTGVECAREGCGQTLTRIAVANHSRYCSRRCAGLLTPTERRRGGDADDVSDDELAKVES